MAMALCAMSHSPLLGLNEPRSEVRAKVDVAREEAEAFVTEFDPDLVVVIGPDHYNGFFYDIMPPFCIGTTATSIGDYDTVGRPVAGGARHGAGDGGRGAGRRGRRRGVRADEGRPRAGAAAGVSLRRAPPLPAGGPGLHQLRGRAAGAGPPGSVARGRDRSRRRRPGPTSAAARLRRALA